MVLSNSVSIYGRLPANPTKREVNSQYKKVYGLNFPLGSRPEGGFFSKESGISLVKNNLKQLLLTERGERIMLPRYGANLRKFLFEPLDDITFNGIKETILTTINRYSKGIEVLKLAVNPLDTFGAEGLQAIQIVLLVKVEEIENTSFEVKLDLS